MIKNPHINRIIIIVVMVITIAILLYFLSSNFLFDRDLQVNDALAAVENGKMEADYNDEDDRVYHIVYDSQDEISVELKENVERVVGILKLKYTVSDISSDLKQIAKGDYVLLAAKNWIDNTDKIDTILDEVSNGANLLILSVPGDDPYFIMLQQRFHIYNNGDKSLNQLFKIENDIMVGLEPEDEIASDAVSDFIHEIFVTDEAKVYIKGNNDIPLYYTFEFGGGYVGIYNGDILRSRLFDGFIVGMMGTLGGDFAYPIIDSAVMFMDDWPAPFIFRDEKTYEQYGMDYSDFLEYVWWPDIVSLIERYEIELSSALLIEYNDTVAPPYDSDYEVLSSTMYSHYKQVMSHSGEVGFHGYNHMPLWFDEYYDEELKEEYKNWSSIENAAKALDYAVSSFENAFPNYDIHFYVPPSNVIDDEGISLIKDALGTPLVICGLYYGTPPQTPSFDYHVKDDVIYFSRLTSGYIINDDAKLLISLGATFYGVFSHFIHPDDVVAQSDLVDADWEDVFKEFGDYLEFIDERLPFLEYMSATDAASNTANWYSMDYDIGYFEDYIKISCAGVADEYSMILRTEKDLIQGEGYEYQRIGDRTYYLKISDAQVEIRLEDSN